MHPDCRTFSKLNRNKPIDHESHPEGEDMVEEQRSGDWHADKGETPDDQRKQREKRILVFCLVSIDCEIGVVIPVIL